MLFVKSKPPLPTRSLRSLRAAARSIRSALCLHLAHPFVAAAEKRPVSCREAKGLVTEFWSPRFVTIQYSDCEAFSLHGLEVGLPAFQLPMFPKCDAVPKEDLLDMFVSCLFKTTRSLRFLRAAAPSTSSVLWLHHAHPFVAAAEKCLSHAEKQRQRVWSRSCRLQDLLRTIQ